MGKKPKDLPDFRSEEEEVLFWDTHHPADYFTEPADLIIRLKRSRKKMVSVRIEQELQDDLKAIAGQHGIPYQKLMRELIRSGVADIKRRAMAARREPARRVRKPASA
jgi:predicted DNA binding CopG/RHH family protein